MDIKTKFEPSQEVYVVWATNRYRINKESISRIEIDRMNGDFTIMYDFIHQKAKEDMVFATFEEAKERAIELQKKQNDRYLQEIEALNKQQEE